MLVINQLMFLPSDSIPQQVIIEIVNKKIIRQNLASITACFSIGIKYQSFRILEIWI